MDLCTHADAATDTANDGMDEFFAPVESDLVGELVGQYRRDRKRIEDVAEFAAQEINGGVLHFFLNGNFAEELRHTATRSARDLFKMEGAVAALNSAYWSDAMKRTDVLDVMPQARRDEWFKSIREMTCPDFEEETVRSTFQDLLASRMKFLAERVDGIFRGLSGEHVTNSPAGFGKRMIIAYVLSDFGYGNHSKTGLINDLRCVVAKFMGRGEPNYGASDGLINTLKGRWGEWVTVDGGAMKIRLYKKGTAHMEIHPDMAWRLNSILAHLYPSAIPAKFRTKPARRPKDVPLMQRPLPFAVIEVLNRLEPAYRLIRQEGNWRQEYRRELIPNALQFPYSGNGKHAKTEAEEVLESVGGVKTAEGFWQFDYNPANIVADIIASGCIPDEKSHQFYPTPSALAQKAVELAEIGPEHVCLEPSAGTGALADFMPKGRTHCVEVSQLRADILQARDFFTTCADFMTWDAGRQFDRIVMNPPFDSGRWRAHLEAAARLVKPGGRLVAILPSGARSTPLEGFKQAWHGPFDNAFPGTSVSVAIMVADRHQ